MTTITRKSKHINFGPVVDARLVEMCAHYNLSVTALVIQAVNEKYEAYGRVKYGYKGSSSGTLREGKQAENARILELEAMSDDDLTRHLVELGYFDPDGPYPENDNFLIQHRVVTEGNDRIYYQFQFDPRSKQITYKMPYMNWKELVADLKKKKKI